MLSGFELYPRWVPLTTARGRGYRCLSGSARNCACRGTFPVILESLSSGRSWAHGPQEGCARSGSSTAFVARKVKIKQWMVFGILSAIRMSSLIAFRISERSLSLKRTCTFSLPIFICTFHLSHLFAKIEMPSYTIWLYRHKSSKQKLPYMIAKFSGPLYLQLH